MFSFFQQKKYRNETSLVFVIESGKIISAVIRFDNEKPPEFLYTHKINITFQKDVDPDRLEDLMLSTLKQSAEKILKEATALFKNNGFHKINTYIFLGSPWYIPSYSKAEYIKEKSFFIDEDLVKKIAIEKIGEQKENTVVTHKIISVKANGYDLEHPKGVKANELIVGSIVNTASKKLIKEIENMINLSIIHTNFSYHTTAEAVFPVARELITKRDFVIFIPEHEVSDLIVVRNGNIEKIVSIPYGRHSPVRSISNVFGGEKDGARSMLTLYLADKLNNETKEKIKTLLDLSKNKFQDILRDALWKLSSTIFIPEDIVVSDGHPISKLLGEWIHTEEFSSKTMTIKSFNVYFMENKDIMNKVVAKEKINYLNPLLISVGLYLKNSN